MLSFATPTLIESSPSPSSNLESPTSARSRRIAILPPPPPPPPEPQSPPIPARSPLRPTPHAAAAPNPALSKRKHALIELLSSERAYASDLALIRDIHVPLALGLPVPFPTPQLSPSSPEPSSSQGPPMTKEDARIIFGNVEELAVFSETFCDRLEEAIHGVLDPDGDGKDNVGDLFLSTIPLLKPPYMTYITRHPSALAHLNSLPQTPALTAYLAQTHTLAQSYTHAWDLPSLLIKPVQRLLKYPLLLSAVIQDTEPGEARDRLREARDKVEEVARGVNEGRRRLEVVKGVLDRKHPPPVRLKSIRGFKLRGGSKDDLDQLERLENRLHECEKFAHEFAKNVVDWTISLRDTIAQLEHWSTTFGRVIGLGQPHGSEALDLFVEIVQSQITPIWISLDAAIQTMLLPKLSRLLATTAQPLLLLSHMHALRPQHLQLLDLPISKARPATALLDASQSYLALDAQLRAELPRYIALLERGFLACLGQFADWQARFWREVRAQWVELWDALGVEGDMTAGAAETVKLWWERWEEIDVRAANFGITKPRQDRTSRTSVQNYHPPSHSTTGAAAALATAFVAGPSPTVSLQPPSSPVPSVQSRAPSTKLRRHSRQSIDLEIDMHVLSGGPMQHMATSPDGYSPLSIASSKLRSKRDSDRQSVSRLMSDNSSTTRHKDLATPRISTGRPSTARQGNAPQKKASVDSAGSAMSSPLCLTQQSPSSRTSVRTSGSSVSSFNDRSSGGSLELALNMPGALPSSCTPQPDPHPCDTRPVASISDLVSAISIPVLPGMATFVPVLPTTRSSETGPTASKQTPAAVEGSETRGRPVKKPSMRQRFTDVFRSPSKRPVSRAGAGAPSKSAPELPLPPPPPTPEPVPEPEPKANPPPDVTLYMCTVIHPFFMPAHASQTYRGLSFLSLTVGDILEILSEEGHPRSHEDLPLRLEDESCEDCLLIARHESGVVGWALASFLVILA